MRGIKPFKLSFLSRPFQWGNRYHLGVGVLAYCNFAGDQVFTDVEMWKDTGELLPDPVLDTGIPKSRAEFLVAGSVYQPEGKAAPVRAAKVQVGTLEKTVYAIGDRVWNRGVPTEPQPFVSMPLSWDRAFGGPGFARNPLGKGAAPVGEGDAAVHPLPNLERPGELVTSPRERPEPISFGALDFTWPQRFSLVGTYDTKWMETRFPGFAEDLDWGVWNLAAPDQQQEGFFRGDERIVCEHLHPTKPRIEGRPIDLHARCFVQKREPGTIVFEEVPLQLTTYWIFPEVEKLVLVWHGAAKVREDDGADVEVLMVAGERPGAPRPLSHYEEVLRKRTGEDRAFEVLKDADLFPEEWCGMSPEVDEQMAATTPENRIQKRQRAAAEKDIEETRARVAAAGLDPDEHGPTLLPPEEKPPTLAEVGELVKQKQKEAAAARERAERYGDDLLERMVKFYEEEGLPADELREEMRVVWRGPPAFTADGERAKFRKLSDDAKALGQPVEELDHYATADEPYALWKMREDMERENYRTRGHLQQPAFALAEDVSRARREAIEETVRQGGSLARWDLTGAQLAGVDLRGADLSEAFLESVDFEGALLDGANLTRAMLASSKLGAASLRGARLSGANLGGASLRGTDLSGADLKDAILDGMDVSGATMVEVDLRGATIRSGTFRDVRLDGSNLEQATFVEIVLERVSFDGARLTQALFSKVDLSGLDLSRAILQETTFHATTARGTRLLSADLRGARCVEGALFDDADFRGADLRRANFRGISMQRADFSGARFDEADLSGADLTEAKLYRAVGKRALLVRTVLRDAQAVSVDLFEAILEKADIRGTDFRGANLFGADFALVHGDEKTKVDEAIQDRVRTLPLRQVDP